MIDIPVAFRAWVEKNKSKGKLKERKPIKFGFRSAMLGERVLVFDTETSVDCLQNLLFGSFQVYLRGELIHEGLVAAENLKEEERQILEQYASNHSSTLYAHKAFLKEIFYPEAYKLGTLVVGFNLPFDLSRIATKSAVGRRNRRDGFTFTLSDDYYDPRIHIKAIDSKGAFIKFDFPKGIARGKYFGGNFLDLRRLARALTDKSHSLESACEAYKVEHPKRKAEEHGKVTPKYIDYNRADVLATWELFQKLWDDYGCHPISKGPVDGRPPTLQITQAHSPATIGKAYLRQMGIRPFLDKQPTFSREILGHAMASYYGGRAEVHIRKKIVPVTFVDVTSMYPSVFVLQKLWPWMIAEKIVPVQSPAFTAKIQNLVNKLTSDDLLNPDIWAKLPVLVQIQPNNDVLPLRGKYIDEEPENKEEEKEDAIWQIGINHFTHPEGVWYSLADCLASKLFTGKAVTILNAIGFTPQGIQAGLNPIKLRSEILIDPKSEDFFKKVIEERHRVKKLIKENPANENSRQSEILEHFLKILANSTAYGISAQLNPEKVSELNLKVFGQKTFSAYVCSYEKPGPYANPLIATFVTGAARLLMAMMEEFLTMKGTTYAFCDTDSMAVVGEGPDVADKLIKRFEALNPYDTNEPLIKMEKENFSETEPGKFQQLYFYGISAKRYVLFDLTDGKPSIRKYSLHGLGHLLSPLAERDGSPQDINDEGEEEKPSLGDRQKGKKWVKRIWEYLLALELKQPVRQPLWFRKPALAQLSISQPTLWEPLKQNDKPYHEQIKPFGFMLVGFYSELVFKGRKPPRPIAPYEKNPEKWPTLSWRDARTGELLTVDFESKPTHLAGHVHFKTYADVVEEFLFHPEVKAAEPDGTFCKPDTRGTLGRLHIRASKIKHIGKEANNLDKVQVLGGAEEEQLEYEPAWKELKKELQKYPPTLLTKFSGLSRKAIYKLLQKDAIPRLKTIRVLRNVIETLKTESVQ